MYLTKISQPYLMFGHQQNIFCRFLIQDFTLLLFKYLNKRYRILISSFAINSYEESDFLNYWVIDRQFVARVLLEF